MGFDAGLQENISKLIYKGKHEVASDGGTISAEISPNDLLMYQLVYSCVSTAKRAEVILNNDVSGKYNWKVNGHTSVAADVQLVVCRPSTNFDDMVIVQGIIKRCTFGWIAQSYMSSVLKDSSGPPPYVGVQAGGSFINTSDLTTIGFNSDSGGQLKSGSYVEIWQN